MIRLLEKEMRLQRDLASQRNSLDQVEDFVKVRTFDEISRGLSTISMDDLLFYLECNGFLPRREDIEAILRRCDHDGNRLINYEEFCEAIGQLADAEEMKDSAEEDVVEKEFKSPDAKEEVCAVQDEEELEGQVLSAEKTLHKSDLEVRMEPPKPRGDIKGDGVQPDVPPAKQADEGIQPDEAPVE